MSPPKTRIKPPEIAKPPEMIQIPAGVVIMGTSSAQVRALLEKEEWAEEWYEGNMFQVEQPQHRPFVPAFEMARAPVTNGDYHIFTMETGYRIPRGWLGFHPSEEELNNPITNVSRIDALAYITWLNHQLEGMPYRLPTEVEWERSARGDDDRIYPWGNDFDPWRCNTLESARRATTVIGSFSPSGDSPFGVTDLAGNVWEWTSTLLKPYPYEPQDGREELKGDGVCVVRGGSWYYTRKLARCSCREGILATFTSPALGFRLARSIADGSQNANNNKY
jgi:toxoflavin biosynthesis protein ToxD